MAPTTISLEVTNDHSVPVEPSLGGSVTVLNVSGGTLYYADNSQVSAANNQGSLTAGQSQTFSPPQWLRSASLSTVTVTVNDPVVTSNSGVTITSPDSSVAVAGTAVAPTLQVAATGRDALGVIFARDYTAGGNAGGDDTAGLNAALAAARAVSTLSGGVGRLILDPTIYYISAPLNCLNVAVEGQGQGSTKIQAKSDWAASLPVNSQFMLDMQPSVALGAPVQTAPSQAGGTSAYLAGQVVSIWVTASNSRNGGETPVSGRQPITITTGTGAGDGNSVTVNWTAKSGADATTTYNVYMDRAGGTNSAVAVKVASGQTGTSFTDATGTGGSGNPPTTDTTGGVGIMAPDFSRIGSGPTTSGAVYIKNLFLRGTFTRTYGSPPGHFSGIRQTKSSTISGVGTAGVFAGIYQNLDHETIRDCNNLDGYYSIYRGEPAGDGGDQVVENCVLTGTWAGIGVASTMYYTGAHFRKVHIAVAPYGFYKEAVSLAGGAYNINFVVGCDLSEIAFESTGNGSFFAAGASSPNVSNNIFDNVNNTNVWDTGSGQQLGTAVTDWLGTAIGRMNTAIDLNSGGFGANSVFAGDPFTIHAGVSTYTCGIAAKVSGGGIYDATALINRLQTDGKPFTNLTGGTNGDQQILFGGAVCRLYRAATLFNQLDLAMASGGGSPQMSQSDGSIRPGGVALVAVAAAGTVLVAQRGVVFVNSGTNTIAAGQAVRSDPTQVGCVMPVATGGAQSIQVYGTPTAGTFQLGLGGQFASINFNSTAAQMQTALVALSTIGAGNVKCLGGPFPGTPIKVIFTGALAGVPQGVLQIGTNSLTGGTTPTPQVSQGDLEIAGSALGANSGGTTRVMLNCG